MFVYLDNIIIFCRDVDKHPMGSNSKFVWKKYVTFSVSVSRMGKVKTDPEKVKAILDWPTHCPQESSCSAFLALLILSSNLEMSKTTVRLLYP